MGEGRRERGGGGEESLTDSTESKLTAEQYPQNRHIHLWHVQAKIKQQYKFMYTSLFHVHAYACGE